MRDLTAEELMALRLMAAGLTEEHAARAAGVSTRTFRRRLESAREQLGGVSLIQAVALACHRGLILPEASGGDLRAAAWEVFRPGRERARNPYEAANAARRRRREEAA